MGIDISHEVNSRGLIDFNCNSYLGNNNQTLTVKYACTVADLKSSETIESFDAKCLVR